MPIVRKNMQGLNGVELKLSEYERILELGKCNAEIIKYDKGYTDKEYNTEKDVEDKIIKPLLRQLGYKENDYTQCRKDSKGAR